MTSSPAIFANVAVLFAVLFVGCDPGYEYRPLDPKGVPLREWTQTINGVRISIEPWHELVGSSSTLRSMKVTNESDEQVIVEGAELETKGRIIAASAPDAPRDRESRAISPKTTKTVVLYWDFGSPAYEVLGPDITWVFHIRIGAEEQIIRVPMGRK